MCQIYFSDLQVYVHARESEGERGRARGREGGREGERER